MAEGQVVAVLVFALFLGIGLSLTRTAAARRLEEALQGLFDVSSRLVQLVVVVAPLGVAALVFTTTARLGPSVLRGLAAYVLVVVAGLALHLFGVYSIVLRVAGRTRPSHFFRAVRMPMATAFSTASSNATLPTAIQAADEALDLPKPVSRFVLTLGATMNQNGTALFQAVTVLFLAELYGVHLSVGKELVVAGICLLAGIGTAGIPAGMVPILVTILAAVGIPAEGVGLVLGVDRLLDMCRTTVNVTGDLVEAVVVSRAMPESS
jgi:DAACS family dicarboxylate/amino acid:cation (Na+ or H+) symporter